MSTQRGLTHPSGLFYCHICGEHCSERLFLKEHLRRDHDFEPTVLGYLDIEEEANRASAVSAECEAPLTTCSRCGKILKSYKGLKQHIGKIHLSKYKYKKCLECGAKFKNKYALAQHKRQVHLKLIT